MSNFLQIRCMLIFMVCITVCVLLCAMMRFTHLARLFSLVSAVRPDGQNLPRTGRWDMIQGLPYEERVGCE